MIVALLVVVAVAVLLWPTPPAAVSPYAKREQPLPAPALPRGVDYLAAVEAVQLIRKRLVATEKLDAEQQKALDTLTLALSSGSDK